MKTNNDVTKETANALFYLFSIGENTNETLSSDSVDAVRRALRKDLERFGRKERKMIFEYLMVDPSDPDDVSNYISFALNNIAGEQCTFDETVYAASLKTVMDFFQAKDDPAFPVLQKIYSDMEKFFPFVQNAKKIFDHYWSFLDENRFQKTNSAFTVGSYDHIQKAYIAHATVVLPLRHDARYIEVVLKYGTNIAEFRYSIPVPGNHMEYKSIDTGVRTAIIRKQNSETNAKRIAEAINNVY